MLVTGDQNKVTPKIPLGPLPQSRMGNNQWDMDSTLASPQSLRAIQNSGRGTEPQFHPNLPTVAGVSHFCTSLAPHIRY